MNNLKKIMLLAFLSVASATMNAQTEKQSSVTDGMFIRGNEVYYIKSGQVNRLPAGNQDLAGNSKINAFGLITYADGSTHQLVYGELSDFSGKVSAGLLEEYITVKNGNAVIVTNGITSPVNYGFKFSDDKQIDAYGTLSDGQKIGEGQKMGIIDRQILWGSISSRDHGIRIGKSHDATTAVSNFLPDLRHRSFDRPSRRHRLCSRRAADPEQTVREMSFRNTTQRGPVDQLATVAAHRR